MKTVKTIVLISISLAILTGMEQAYGQTKTSTLNIDSIQRDNTRVVKEKHIKDTSLYNPIGDTAVKTNTPGKSKQKNQNMYVVPDSVKKKTGKNKSN